MGRMQIARFAVLLVVLVPFLGQAQDFSAPSDSPLAPPPLVSAPQGSMPEHPHGARLLTEDEEEGLSQEVRIGLEAGMSLVGAVLGGYLGDAGAHLVHPKWDIRFYASMVLASGTLVMTTAVYGAGTLAGGRGRFLPTLLGGVLGAVLPGVLYSTGMLTTRTPNEVALLGLLGLVGLAGPVVGYELSHSAAPAPKRPGPSASTGPRVYPVLSASTEGGTLGLVGQF
jgi:hypothetical protein